MSRLTRSDEQSSYFQGRTAWAEPDIEERSAAEARALCRRGKPKGKTKAEQFAEKWPNSIHLASVKTDCDL